MDFLEKLSYEDIDRLLNNMARIKEIESGKAKDENESGLAPKIIQ